jgi:hypothetical protein
MKYGFSIKLSYFDIPQEFLFELALLLMSNKQINSS